MLTKDVLKHYREQRKVYTSPLYGPSQTTAANALRVAKVQAFVDHNWYDLESAGKVRCRIEPDTDVDYEFLAGDTYNVEINGSTVPGGKRTIEAQEKAFKRSLEMDGVWGYIVEVRCPCCDNWEHVDSCWGFTGDPYKDDMEGETLWAKKEAIDIIRNRQKESAA